MKGFVVKPWKLLATAPVPQGEGELKLYQHDQDFVIKVDHIELMNSRVHGSEDALAELTIQKIDTNKPKRILIGGLGMGFTLAKALESIGPEDTIDVAELSPDVLAWNKEYLGNLTDNPLNDPRVTVHVMDVIDIMRSNQRCFDAVILDVDNGPEGLTKDDNNRIYSSRGLSSAFQALKPHGIYSVWSSGDSEIFTERMKKSNFEIEKTRVHERANGKGGKHVIWFGTKKAGASLPRPTGPGRPTQFKKKKNFGKKKRY